MRHASFALLALLVACGTDGGDEEIGSCDNPCQISTAASGGGCQVNLYCTTTEPAVYCSEDGAGGWDCSCGAAVDSPPEFASATICDLEMEAAACEALAACSNWVVD